MNHRAADPAFTASWGCLVVLAEPPVSTEPGEGAFDDPALCQHDETTLALEFGYDPEQEAELVGSPVLELARVASIGPDSLESGVAVPVELGKNLFCSITVLYVGLMNRESVDQPECVDRDVALSATDLLAGVVSSRPPFSVVSTDWLSRTAALGEGS